MKKVKFGIAFENPKEEFVVEGEFSDSEIIHLRKFNRHVSELNETKVISEGFPRNLKISWKQELGTVIETEEIDEEYLNSFIHKLRPLILDEEPASFRNISAFIGKKFKDNAGIRRQLKCIRHNYENSEFRKYGQFTIGEIPIFDEKTLRKWLNASEYHQDSDKKALLKGIESELSIKGAKRLFVVQLRDKAVAINILGQLTRLLTDFNEIIDDRSQDQD